MNEKQRKRRRKENVQGCFQGITGLIVCIVIYLMLIFASAHPLLITMLAVFIVSVLIGMSNKDNTNSLEPENNHKSITTTEQFIKKMEFIRERLNAIENEYAELHLEYAGDKFDTQDKYAAEFENLTLMLTHELSSQIEFGISDLKTLSQFINFRKKYNAFSNDELLNIIDNNLNSNDKLELLKQDETKGIDDINSEWNHLFNNIGYEKLCKKLRLNNS